MHPWRYQEHLVDIGRQQVSEIVDYQLRYVKHHRVSPFVQVFPFYLCFISYLETSWYLPSFTYLSIWLIPISHYLQKLVVMRQITSYHFASSLSVHSKYLSFRLCHPASRTFVQCFPSPASIAQCSVLRPESSLAFSIEFSVVSSLPTSCTTLASFLSRLRSKSSLLSTLVIKFLHCLDILESLRLFWLAPLFYSTRLSSLLHSRTTEGVPLHFRGF